MNEKLKEFAAQAGFTLSGDWHCCDYELARFAELVRQDEREACAKLADDWFASTAGRAIRERGLT